MEKIYLKKIDHDRKMGEVCPSLKPNVTDDCLLYDEDELIGFYLRKMPDRMCKLANLANSEFNSDNVPKKIMSRASVSTKKEYDLIKKNREGKKIVKQYSTIIGSIPPKAQFKRNYNNYSSVHSYKPAQNFIKAMLLLAIESEKLILEHMPEQYKRQKELLKKVPQKWRFGNLFTSSISNYNISAPFHRDAGNIKGAVNVIICKQLNSKGGDLHVPDYDATFGQVDNSVLVYPAWRNMHAVTPIVPTHEGGYRNSLVFYALNAFTKTVN